MFKKNVLRLICSLAVMAVSLAACDSSDDNGSTGGQKVISVKKVVPSGGSTVYNFVYYSLKNGTELDGSTAAATQDWDLRFTASTKIMTNSGATATEESSGGIGGSAYSGSTNFDSAIDVSALTIQADYTVYAEGHDDPETLMNVISFPGYETGDGTSGNPYDDADFSADAYFSYSGMPPVYVMTDKVYVVKFGDGSGYAKFQVLSVEYASEDDTPSTGDKTTTYNFLINYETL